MLYYIQTLPSKNYLTRLMNCNKRKVDEDTQTPHPEEEITDFTM